MILYRAIIRPIYDDYEYAVNILRAETQYIELHTRRETPCGYWVWFKGKEKWISKTGTKRFAYPTKEQALHSLMCRTKTRLYHLKTGIEIVEKWGGLK